MSEIEVLERGPFRGFPELFRTVGHHLVVEDPDGFREIVGAVTGSHGPGRAVVGSIPAGRILVRLDENIYADQNFVVWNLIVPCEGHVWELRKVGYYEWEQCASCGVPRQPILRP